MQPGWVLSVHLSEHDEPVSHTTGWQASPRQSKLHVLTVLQVVVQLPLVQLKRQLLPGPQLQAEPRQSPSHRGLVPEHSIAQLPPMQSKLQRLPGPQVQLLPEHSPLHGSFAPAQLTAQLPFVHSKSQAAPASQVQSLP